MKRAVVYIRVSTKDQARRDGNPEGYSLPTQRRDCEARAASLGAVVVDEYIDKDTGTRTDKRPRMMALLERVHTQRDIDYVIVFKLDRWARNAREDLVNDYLLEQAGAELVSCSEHIDRTNAGRMSHIFLAGINEYQSRNSGDEIKRKTLQKVMDGGTPGPARLGYMNVGEGARRWVEADQDRAPLITWAFETYATGEWSEVALLEELTARGLRSRGGPNTPSKPLSLSQMNRILRSPYYKGIVVYNGVEYQGKHEPLVDDDTWQQVQDMLASKRRGEKQREHHHYLKGTIYCGHCGSRLCVTYAKGRGGVYPYYFCVGRQQKRTTCMLKYRPIAVVEEQIEDHYAFVQLTAQGLTETGQAVLAELEHQQAMQAAERQHQATRLRQLDDERTKLLHAHYAGAVPLDLLKSEQQRIADEIATVKGRLAAAHACLDQMKATVNHAVREAENCHRAYVDSSPEGRRLMNQAFFNRVLVTEEGVVGWEYNEPFAALMETHAGPHGTLPAPGTSSDKPPTTDAAPQRLWSYERRGPGLAAGALSGACFVSGSKETHLAEGVGFEPTEGCPSHDFQSCRFGRSRIPPGRRSAGTG
jgi:site-specific DNA recombinase